MDLKTRLKGFIDERGLSPYGLSQISGVPQPTIHRILTGESTSPRDSNVKKLAKGLGISEAELRGMPAVTSEEERQLLDSILQLSNEQQKLIKSMIYNLSKKK
jgi:predicted transcriptional regulator